MAQPIPQKTWQIATLVSALTGDDGLNQMDLEIQKKNKRKAFGHVVAGSGNTTTGGMDGIDRWTTTADFGRFSTPFTYIWIVLTQPGTGAQDLIAFYNGGEFEWIFAHSPGGLFTGGGVNSLPTATDETVLASGTWHGRDDGGHATPLICHLWVSTDLTCCRMAYFFNTSNYGNIFLDAVDDPTPGWAKPNYGMADKRGVGKNGGQRCASFVNFNLGSYQGAGVGLFKGWGPHGAMNLIGTAEFSSSPAGDYAMLWCNGTKNKISNTYRNPTRSGLYEHISNADGGWHGRIFDLWWVSVSADDGTTYQFASGSTTPLDGSHQFIIIGDMMLPWNGTVPQIA